VTRLSYNKTVNYVIIMTLVVIQREYQAGCQVDCHFFLKHA